MARSHGRDGNYNVMKKEAQSLKSLKKKGSSAHDDIEVRLTPDIPETDETTPLDPEISEKNPFPMPWKIVLLCLGFLLLFAAGVILGYSFGNDQVTDESSKVVDDLARCHAKEADMKETLSYPQLLMELHDTYVSMIDRRPLDWLEFYRGQQVYSGSLWDEVLVKDITEHLKHYGVFDEIRVENYTCLVSLPGEKGSSLRIISGENDTVIYSENIGQSQNVASRRRRDAVYEGKTTNQQPKIEQTHVPPFVAYSAPGKVEGEVVNVNYGEEDDFAALLNAGVILIGRIALLKTRYTAEPLVAKVKRAEAQGMNAVLVYSEDKLCTTGVHYSTLNPGGGDPQTQGYPSIDGVWRLRELGSLGFSLIPVQTISCDTGYELLSRLSGQKAPQSWVANSYFNSTLYMGRKSTRASPWRVELTNDVKFRNQTIQNIVATVRGYLNPEHVILLGANRNSFDTFSQVSALQATDSLMRVIQPLAAMMTENRWLPKRTLTFAFWGGGDFGDLGRVEHMEYFKSALDQMVVNIDLDDPVDLDLDPSALQVAAPVFLKESIDSIVKIHYDAMDDLDRDDYDTDTVISSGYGPYEEIRGSFLQADFIPSNNSFDVPTIHAQVGQQSSDIEETTIRQTEVTRLVGRLMLSMADQGVIQYNDRRTTWLIKQQVSDLLDVAGDVNTELKRALEAESRKLVDHATTFYHLIDTQVDNSDRDHVTSINQSLLRLNRQFSIIRESITRLLPNIGEMLPSDNLDLDGNNSNTIYSHDVMVEFSELLVSMATANNMMRTVYFPMGYLGLVNVTDASDTWDMDNSQDIDLEGGWV